MYYFTQKLLSPANIFEKLALLIPFTVYIDGNFSLIVVPVFWINNLNDKFLQETYDEDYCMKIVEDKCYNRDIKIVEDKCYNKVEDKYINKAPLATIYRLV